MKEEGGENVIRERFGGKGAVGEMMDEGGSGDANSICPFEGGGEGDGLDLIPLPWCYDGKTLWLCWIIPHLHSTRLQPYHLPLFRILFYYNN